VNYLNLIVDPPNQELVQSKGNTTIDVNPIAAKNNTIVILHLDDEECDSPVAFFSCQLAPLHTKLAAYERELIGLVQAVRHWRPYLWGRPFLIKTDHFSLKFLLDQHLATIPQHQWTSKLIGFDFHIEFQPGAGNVMADALSLRDT
jgi:hypothetical protein